MRIPILRLPIRHWLAAALGVAVGLLQLPSAARAGWTDASSVLTTSATPRAFDAVTKQVFSYVTLTNTGPDALAGPLRLVIPTSNFTVVGASGSAMRCSPGVGAEAPAVSTANVPPATGWRGGNSAR